LQQSRAARRRRAYLDAGGVRTGWAIALVEYIFQVPANRRGQAFTVTQLKIMQECITLVVFTVIAYPMFGEKLDWNNFVSYGLIVGAVYFSFGSRLHEKRIGTGLHRR
jgi:uncharacterized protein (DUF486 family)